MSFQDSLHNSFAAAVGLMATDLMDCSIASWCKKYSKPSLCVADHEVDLLRKIIEVSKAYLKQRALRFVEQHAQEPILNQYGVDCTDTPFHPV